jgi:hypothetical protein
MLMERGVFRIGLLLALVSLALVGAGCGGGGTSTSPSSSSTASDARSAPEPNAEFKTSHGGKKIVNFGEEASLGEWEEANALVVENLKTREAGDWAGQCKTLSQSGLEEIRGTKTRSECPTNLKEIGEPLSRTKKLREDTLPGSIQVLRVKGNRAYALYNGNDGHDYAVPLEKENGQWRVTKLTTIELDNTG